MIRKFRLTTIIGLAAFVAPFSVTSGAGAAANPASVRSTVIVRFVDGTDSAAQAKGLDAQGGHVTRVYAHAFPGVAVELPAAAINALRSRADVASVEADGPVTVVGTQSGATWGLDRIDQRSLPLNGSYAYASDGAGVTAYIIDTGLQGDHVEFTGRTAAGYSAISDGLGTADCNGHGTHVSGTVAGTTYGVAKQATVVPVRVLDCTGSGTWSGVIAGLDWVVANHQAGVPAVANMSLGGGANSSVDTAVQSVIADGVTVAVAAGNSSTDACTTSPARTPEALTVAAADSTDTQASFSNYGTCVDLYAPGVSITSAWYGSTTATNTISGTSMASPHVAGAAARLLSADPTLTPAQVASMLTTSATSGIVKAAGAGTANLLLYVDPAGTVTPPPTQAAPAPATNVTARIIAKKTAAISWTQGAAYPAITSQQVRAYANGTYVTYNVSATATSFNIKNLTSGVSYSFAVVETNAIGSTVSAMSNTIKA